MAKLKVTKGPNYDKIVAAQKKCAACNGSGWYDSYDVENDSPIVCAACDGTGKE